MIDQPASRKLGIFLAFGGMLLVSTDSLITRAVGIDGWTIGFWFGVFSAPAMTLYLFIADRKTHLKVAYRTGPAPLFGSALMQACSSLLFILAVTHTTIANVVVIIAAAPVLAALCATVILGEKSSRRLWMAIIVSLIGIVVVVSGSLGGGGLLGDLLAVGAISSFAVNLTIWRAHPAMSRALAVGIAGAIIALVCAIPAQPLGHSARTYLLLFIMGALIGPLARVMLASATRYLPIAVVSLFTPIETVAGTAWAWLAFNEVPVFTTYIGGAIVLVAVLYGTVFADRKAGVP